MFNWSKISIDKKIKPEVNEVEVIVVPTWFHFIRKHATLITLLLCFSMAICTSVTDRSYFKFVGYVIVIFFIISIILSFVDESADIYFEYVFLNNAALSITRGIFVIIMNHVDPELLMDERRDKTDVLLKLSTSPKEVNNFNKNVFWIIAFSFCFFIIYFGKLL